MTGNPRTAAEQRVLALMPSAKDGERTVAFLEAAGIRGVALPRLSVLCEVFREGGAGAIIVTEDALARGDSTSLG